MFCPSNYVRTYESRMRFNSTMQKTILCTIDFSEFSRHTLDCAANLARELDAHLTILFAYRLVHVKNTEAFERKLQIEKKALLDFSTLENEVLKDKGISYDFKAEVGFVADRIEALSKRTQLGYVVIDRNMSMATRETFDDLVKSISVPMIIVPIKAG